MSVQPVPELAVAGSDGVTILGSTGAVTAKVAIDGGAHGLALVSGVDDGTQLYVSSQDTSKDPQLSIIAVSGTAAKEGPVVTDTMPMPGAVTKVVFDEASEMVEVLGTAPDGSGSTVYIVETHGKSVFADQRVPFAPVAWALDHNPDYPTANRGQLLTFASDGETGTLDIGDYPFAWRLPGVIMGVITVAFLFLLTRILFRRREIAVLVGLFALLDGMFFVQSRIAMNDVYTGAFIVAAYAVVRVAVAQPGQATMGVLDPDARRSASCSASRSPRSGWRPTRSAPSASSSSPARRSGASCSSSG